MHLTNNKQAIRLISDNPNLSHTVLAKLLNVSESYIKKIRRVYSLGGAWMYRGTGIPFTRQVETDAGIYYEVAKNHQRLFRGNFSGAIEQLERLLYCLHHNSGKLPPRLPL